MHPFAERRWQTWLIHQTRWQFIFRFIYTSKNKTHRKLQPTTFICCCAVVLFCSSKHCTWRVKQCYKVQDNWRYEQEMSPDAIRKSLDRGVARCKGQEGTAKVIEVRHISAAWQERSHLCLTVGLRFVNLPTLRATVRHGLSCELLQERLLAVKVSETINKLGSWHLAALIPADLQTLKCVMRCLAYFLVLSL